MKRTPTLRALTFLGSTLLVLAVFEACSNDDSSTSTVAGAPSISITKLSFGPATVLSTDGAPGVCGNPVGVTLNINNWLLKEPGLCQSTPQCGWQVRVTLTKSSDGMALATKVAVSAAVDLNSPRLRYAAGSYDRSKAGADRRRRRSVYHHRRRQQLGAKILHAEPTRETARVAATGGAPGAGSSSLGDAGAGGFGGAAPADPGAAGSDGVSAGWLPGSPRIVESIGAGDRCIPSWLRCSSVTSQRYAPSSRLAVRAPRSRSSTVL